MKEPKYKMRDIVVFENQYHLHKGIITVGRVDSFDIVNIPRDIVYYIRGPASMGWCNESHIIGYADKFETLRWKMKEGE